MDPIRIAIVGMGKIARDQHLPAISGNAAFSLAATVSPRDPGPGTVPHFRTLGSLLVEGPAVDAVVLCTPPQVRHDLAVQALKAGVHTFLEKPPGATLSEVIALKDRADKVGATLFASWHSRFAAGVAPAKAWLAERTIERVSIVWREDVRAWHPGQDWIWEPGGLGVFDPGINALSILTRIVPHALYVTGAALEFPEGRQAPIAAAVTLSDHARADIAADFDWRQTGPQTWDIAVETEAGELKLSQGGAKLEIDGARQVSADDREYDGIYARFGELVGACGIDVDLSPLVHVADAFMLGRRIAVAPFAD